MIIETKCNVGDTVYLAINLERIGLRITNQAIITRIKFDSNDGSIIYDTKVSSSNNTCFINNVYEKFVFKNLNDALKYLENNDDKN